MIKHSPAPWTQYENEDGDVIVKMDEAHEVMIANLEGSCEICHGNARLIEMAPRLLQVLEQIEDYSANTDEIEPESYKELLDSIHIISKDMIVKTRGSNDNN